VDNSSDEVVPTQPLKFRGRPRIVSELLDLREIRQRFGLDHRRIYAWVGAGLLHAVQVGGDGRVYYPAWELEDLVKNLPTGDYPGQSEFERVA
jgi:hypothetical protein